MLIESWKEFEVAQGDAEAIAAIRSKMPKRVIRRRPIKAPDGVCSSPSSSLSLTAPSFLTLISRTLISRTLISRTLISRTLISHTLISHTLISRTLVSR
jgi:hypothetical protein